MSEFPLYLAQWRQGVTPGSRGLTDVGGPLPDAELVLTVSLSVTGARLVSLRSPCVF